MRQIDFNAPLSEDDKAWLRDRDRHSEIAQNEARFGEGEDLEENEPEAGPDYDKWSTADLKAEAQTRGIDFSGMRKKAELALALRENDATAKSDAAE